MKLRNIANARLKGRGPAPLAVFQFLLMDSIELKVTNSLSGCYSCQIREISRPYIHPGDVITNKWSGHLDMNLNNGKPFPFISLPSLLFPKIGNAPSGKSGSVFKINND